MYAPRERHGLDAPLSACAHTPQGRDKFYRLSHFVLKDLAWIFENVIPLGKGNKTSDTCERIANGLMQGRRFFRIGSVPASIQGILAALREQDPVLRITALGSRITSLLFLVLDHASWMSRQGLFGMNYDEWVFYDCLFWLVSIIFQLVHDRRAFLIVEAQQAKLRSQWFDSTDRVALERDIAALDARKRAVSLDFIRNLLDLPLALNGVFRFSRPAAIVFNLVGTASSLAGTYQTWPK